MIYELTDYILKSNPLPTGL